MVVRFVEKTCNEKRHDEINCLRLKWPIVIFVTVEGYKTQFMKYSLSCASDMCFTLKKIILLSDEATA